MKQEPSTGNGNPLLAQAASRLRPEIFSHPVWVRFGRVEASASLKIVDELLYAARSLQDDDPSSACQILLISAVYQNYAGRHDDALRTTQQALALAERNKLANEMIWATWGACAVCFQENNYEQASRYLEYLQAGLSEQNEWILADFVEVVEQSLLHPGSAGTGERSGSSDDQSRGDLLSVTFDRLRHWGFSAQASGPNFETDADRSMTHALPQGRSIHPSFSGEHRRGTWDSLVLAIKGELSLQWVERNGRHAGQRASAWRSILGSIRSHLPGRKIEPQTIEDLTQIPSISILPPIKESSPPNAPVRKKKPVSTIEKVNRNQRSGQATTFVPVAVHMLGVYSMTIGELTVKLPASRGLSLLKYLLFHHNQATPREILMDIFWPDAEPETARNNLNVAMHSLRRALRAVIFLPVIVFEDGAYSVEPDLQVWLDVEEFERCVKAGQQLEARDQLTAAVAEYETAISLYQGDFLEQSLYEEWTLHDRERLRIAYLDTLDHLSQIYFSQERYAACVTLCQFLLSRDPCREDAHCRLMQCYSRLRESPLALRQYQICAEALRVELEANPAPETTRLYNRIRRHERV